MQHSLMSAGRVVAQQSDGRYGDYEALRSLSTSLASLTSSATVKRVIIFKAPSDGQVPANCLAVAVTGAKAGVSGPCNVYGPTQVANASLSNFSTPTACSSGAWDGVLLPAQPGAPDRAGRGLHRAELHDPHEDPPREHDPQGNLGLRHRAPPDRSIGMRRTTSRSPRGARRRARDDGYVVALVALILLPMLAITGFAVDLGAWYARASKVQQAADAAALAGVQDLPNLPAATATARAVAAQNGFTNGVNGISVTVVQVPDPTAKLKVTISDPAVQQFFTKPFRSNVSIERTGTAQYLKPISMGSPKNFLGTATLAIQSNGFRENFWLAVSGGCASKENGDRIQAQTDSNFTSTANPATGSNPWAGVHGRLHHPQRRVRPQRLLLRHRPPAELRRLGARPDLRPRIVHHQRER